MKHRRYGAYIVDNEWMNIIEDRRMIPLRENGFRVVGCSTDPEEAIEKIAALNPELVISELHLNKMSGITLMRTVRESGVVCDFVLFSATATKDLMQRFYQDGGCDYWIKPLIRREWHVAVDTLKTVYGKLVGQQL